MKTTTTPSLTCSQCGGELHPDEGQIFLVCPYCSATVFIDKSRVVFHWYLTPTVDETEARASLARWMAGNDTVKDLDQKSTLVGQGFEYFPMWYFKCQENKEEVIRLEPAAATSVTELRQLPLSAGDLHNYDDSVSGQATPPTVPLDTAHTWLQERLGAPPVILESALVHLPVYTFKYTYQDQVFTAVVEAATGKTLANVYPAKAEAPYLTAGIVTALVFLCLALAPVIGWSVSGQSGLGIGLLVCAGAGVVAAPALFAFAAWVAAKI